MDRSRPGWKHFWRQNGWKKPSELALFNCRAPSWLVSLIYIYIDLFIDVYIYIYLLSLFGVLFLTLILLLVGSICVILRAFLRAEGRGGEEGCFCGILTCVCTITRHGGWRFTGQGCQLLSIFPLQQMNCNGFPLFSAEGVSGSGRSSTHLSSEWIV